MPLSSSLPIWCSLSACRAPPAWKTTNSRSLPAPPDPSGKEAREQARRPATCVACSQSDRYGTFTPLPTEDADSEGAVCFFPSMTCSRRAQETHAGTWWVSRCSWAPPVLNGHGLPVPIFLGLTKGGGWVSRWGQWAEWGARGSAPRPHSSTRQRVLPACCGDSQEQGVGTPPQPAMRRGHGHLRRYRLSHRSEQKWEPSPYNPFAFCIHCTTADVQRHHRV